MLFSRRLLDVSRKMKAALSRRLASAAARPYNQLRVLQEIGDDDGCSQGALAERMCLDAPAISRIVTVLVDDGLVRRRDTDDRRRVALQITAAGQRELQTLRDQQQWLDAQLQKGLSAAEKKQLEAVLSHLDEIVDELE